MSRVSITCSGGGDRERCLRRRKKRAPMRSNATNTKAPSAIPTLAPVERPLDELGRDFEVDVEVVDARVVVIVVVPTGGAKVVIWEE